VRTVHNRLALAVVLALVALLFLAGRLAYQAATAPDTQCLEQRAPVASGSAAPTTAADLLAVGDADFDRGDCEAAVAAYTRAIAVDPTYAEAYNNRAYTRMRQQRYELALPDLDRAIELRPDYVNALLNRGDVRNYYYAVDRRRAVEDYDRIIALGPEARRGSAVCGHRMIALNGGWGPGIYLQLAARGLDAGCFG
jgi:tetratricopeptide (TPR) repeat protein